MVRSRETELMDLCRVIGNIIAREMYLWFAFLLMAAIPASAEFHQVILGDSVPFQMTENCKEGEDAKLIHRLSDDTPHHVASLQADGWSPGDRYISRMNKSLILRNVNVNDGRLYEFTCNGRVVGQPIELSVIIPVNVSVSERMTAVLPCFAVTVGKNNFLLRWEKERELVLQTLISGKPTYGSGLNESRVSVSPDWFQVGDLSLTIPAARRSDGGLYYCSNGDARALSAVRLEVRGESFQEQPQTTPPKPPSCPQWTKTPIITTTVLAACLVVLSIFLVWKLKIWTICTRRDGHNPQRRGGEEGNTAERGHADNNHTPLVELNGHI